MAISKNILVREVSKKTKLGPEEVSVVIDTFIETIQEHACKGEAVVIKDLFRIFPCTVTARRSNLYTHIFIPEHTTMKCKLSSSITRTFKARAIKEV